MHCSKVGRGGCLCPNKPCSQAPAGCRQRPPHLPREMPAGPCTALDAAAAAAAAAALQVAFGNVCRYAIRAGDTLTSISERSGAGPALPCPALPLLHPKHLAPGICATGTSGRRQGIAHPPSHEKDSFLHPPWHAPTAGVPVAEIARSNSIQNPDEIFAGDTLVLPAGWCPDGR